MQNSNETVADGGTALRELSLDEAEMVGGGFSWGGIVHGVEHAGSNVLHAAEAGFGAAVGAGAGIVGSKAAKWAWKEIKDIKLPKFRGGGPGPEEPELPPQIFLG
jgi:hypothetical protein